MPRNDDRSQLPRRPLDPGAAFDPFRNTTLVLSIGVARFGRADVEAVLFTLCQGDMLATARDGQQDHAEVLTLHGRRVEYTFVHRLGPTRKGKQASPWPTRRIVTLRLVGEG